MRTFYLKLKKRSFPEKKSEVKKWKITQPKIIRTTEKGIRERGARHLLNRARAPFRAVPVKKAPVAKPKREPRRTPVRIIPLGGLNEIGKNMTVIECSNDMFIIDCGLAFPDTEMPGVDIVIPDFTYVEKNRDKLRGVVLTHGHEDHIGGLAYLLKKVNVPVYGTKAYAWTC